MLEPNLNIISERHSMKRGKETGFAVLEVVMIIIIVLLIGAVTLLFVQNNQEKTGKSNTAQSSAPSKSPKVKASETNVPGVNNQLSDFSTFDEESMRGVLLQVYAPESADSGTEKITRDELLEKYATKSLLKYYKDLYASSEPVLADPICLCQNSWNDVQVSNIRIEGGRATANITLGFADPYVLTVTMVNEDGPKLDTIKSGRNRTPYVE